MKPDWCPQDIWAITGMEFDELYEQEDTLEGDCEHGIRVSMAKLMMEARSQAFEEAAQIAEDWVGPARLLPLGDDAHNEGAGIGMYEAGERIAQAIRQHYQKGRDAK